MTPEQRSRADALSASAFQLCCDLMDAQRWAETAQVAKIRRDLETIAIELVPLLIQYQGEQARWKEGRPVR